MQSFDQTLLGMSQLALPPRPLLNTNRVTGARKSILQSVSIRLTLCQKTEMT